MKNDFFREFFGAFCKEFSGAKWNGCGRSIEARGNAFGGDLLLAVRSKGSMFGERKFGFPSKTRGDVVSKTAFWAGEVI